MRDNALPLSDAKSPPLWRGWFRQSKRHAWRVVSEGDDEMAVHHAMLDAGTNGEFILCRGSINPNDSRELRR
jgi:hypothetical protein